MGKQLYVKGYWNILKMDWKNLLLDMHIWSWTNFNKSFEDKQGHWRVILLDKLTNNRLKKLSRHSNVWISELDPSKRRLEKTGTMMYIVNNMSCVHNNVIATLDDALGTNDNMKTLNNLWEIWEGQSRKNRLRKFRRGWKRTVYLMKI